MVMMNDVDYDASNVFPGINYDFVELFNSWESKVALRQIELSNKTLEQKKAYLLSKYRNNDMSLEALLTSVLLDWDLYLAWNGSLKKELAQIEPFKVV